MGRSPPVTEQASCQRKHATERTSPEGACRSWHTVAQGGAPRRRSALGYCPPAAGSGTRGAGAWGWGAKARGSRSTPPRLAATRTDWGRQREQRALVSGRDHFRRHCRCGHQWAKGGESRDGAAPD